MHYVYTLTDTTGEVLHVGETIRPKVRLYEHTVMQPIGTGKGMFYGRTDINLTVISEHPTKKLAYRAQCKLQNELGLDSDLDKLIAYGKSEDNPRFKTHTCPHCGKEADNALAMKRWHFDRCKQKDLTPQ